MKILLVHNRYQIPGGEDVVFDQERQMLEQAGHEVVTYMRSNYEGESWTGFRRIALVKNIAWSSDTRVQLAHLLQEAKPDIVHVHNTFMMMSSSVFAACKEAGIPVVQTLHNYRMFCPAANYVRDGKVCEECREHGVSRGVRYGCYRGSRGATASVALAITTQHRRKSYPDRFIALTEFSRQKFIAGGIAGEKVCVKPNFVAPDPGRGSGTGEYAIYAGRLSDEKGLDTLLSAWKRLPRIPLEIVGDGPLLAPLQTKAAALGLPTVRFHGRLPRNKTLGMIKLARFLVAPSQCYENFPMGIAEAFACAVPVICSRLGGMQEIVQDARTGVFFTPGDEVDLAEKVHAAWSNPAQTARMAHEARWEYESKYTAEKNYPLLLKIYQEMIASRSPMVAQETEVLSLSHN
jgi:glycosyltransferase involved in cell wall biosynthesis